jgi:RNA polymerase sigma factor (sigma-70 family)
MARKAIHGLCHSDSSDHSQVTFKGMCRDVAPEVRVAVIKSDASDATAQKVAECVGLGPAVERPIGSTELSREKVNSVIADLEAAYGHALRRIIRQFISTMKHGPGGFDEDDVIQNVWLRVARVVARKGVAHLRSPWSFLRILAVHFTIDQIRRRKYEMRVLRAYSEIDAGRTDADPDEGDAACELHVVLREALNKLDRVDKLLVVLRYINGLSSFEIQEKLGMPAGTVRRRCLRAKARLRDLLRSP